MKETFSERVVEAALSIPKGKVASYGDIARACGGGGQAARSVNSILVRAYHRGQKDIPFHRIVYSDGRIWKQQKGTSIRSSRYREEGIEINEKGYVVNFHSKRYEF